MTGYQAPLAAVSLAGGLSPLQIPQNANIKASRTDLVIIKFAAQPAG